VLRDYRAPNVVDIQIRRAHWSQARFKSCLTLGGCVLGTHDELFDGLGPCPTSGSPEVGPTIGCFSTVVHSDPEVTFDFTPRA